MKSIAFGPYLGDFKYEVFYFLPYINWVREVLKPETTFVASHFNRRFLYDDIVEEFFPINPIISVDEFSQKNHFNKNIFKSTFTALEKDFKSIFDKDVSFYNFDYRKFKIPCSLYQLKFNKLRFDLQYRIEDRVLYIPDRHEKEPYLNEVYLYLKEILKDKLMVIGDCKTYLHKENVLLSSPNYHETVYKNMINYISSCRAVICPSSVWTGVANLQEKPVLSWGNLISEYKDGKYHFNNKKGKFYPKLELKNLKSCINLFLEEKC